MWRLSGGWLEIRPAGSVHFLPYSTSQSSATWQFLAARTQGHVVFLGEPRKQRRNAYMGEYGFFCHTLQLSTWLQILSKEQQKKNQSTELMDFLNGNTEYLYMSIIFKVNLQIHNFNVQIHNSNRKYLYYGNSQN